ncbi:MAG: four helix bundle protein [Cyanobacteria bacterium]|nr:four helix bundle protein [Cyanobacteriota bacterium]
MSATNIGSFRDLEVWQRAMDLVDLVYVATKSMPSEEFDLRRQIRRAVISIPSNIAEGYRRKKKRPAYQNHVSISLGHRRQHMSCLELSMQGGQRECLDVSGSWEDPHARLRQASGLRR